MLIQSNTNTCLGIRRAGAEYPLGLATTERVSSLPSISGVSLSSERIKPTRTGAFVGVGSETVGDDDSGTGVAVFSGFGVCVGAGVTVGPVSTIGISSDQTDAELQLGVYRPTLNRYSPGPL